MPTMEVLDRDIAILKASIASRVKNNNFNIKR
jgi:hypothetical protein